MNAQLYLTVATLVVLAVGGHLAVAVWLWRLSRQDEPGSCQPRDASPGSNDPDGEPPAA